MRVMRITVLLLLLAVPACYSPERSQVREEAPVSWQPVEEVPVVAEQTVAEEPDPVSESAPLPAVQEAVAVQTVVESEAPGSRFLPARLVVWRALAHPEHLDLTTERSLTVSEDKVSELSYLHPFFDKHEKLKPLVRRVIAKDGQARTFDMRDALVLPAPARLDVTVPAFGGSRLSFSYCVLPDVFPGEPGPAVGLEVSLPQKGSLLFKEQWTVQGAKGCRRWSEVRLDLEDADRDRQLRFAVTGEGKPSQAVVIANLSLEVTVEGGNQATLDAVEKITGPAGGPNVLIVFIDAARSDCTGPGNKTFPSVTPVLDKLAAQGVAFVKAFSISNQTRASIVGLLQSQHPTVGGFHSRWWHVKQRIIDAYYASRPVLITRLANAAGYLSASLGRNHFQYGTTRMGLDPGFDVVFDNRKATGDTEEIIDRAIGWLEENRESKFFLLVNISPPHQPYTAPASYQEWTDNRLAGLGKTELPARKDYLGELYFADQEVGRLLAGLERMDLTRETVILVTADHGETMHPLHHCKSELYKTICHNSHGLTLFDEELHVPLIWSAPILDRLAPGVRENDVTHLDVAPTLLELMGLSPHPRFLGRSLTPDMKGQPGADEEVYAETRMSSAVRLGGWKFVLHHKKDDARTQAWLSGPEGTLQELYDLSVDPGETRNLVGKHPVKARELRAALRRIRTGFADRAQATSQAVWHPADGRPEKQAPEKEAPEKPEVVHPPPAEETGGTGGTSGTSATHYVAFNADRDRRVFAGAIRVEGRVLEAERLGEHGCLTKTGGNTLAVSCELESRTALARIRVSPRDAPVYFDVTMDGTPLPASRFYVGRYGLALRPQTQLAEPQDFALAYSRGKPHFLPGFDAGLFAWHASARLRQGENAPVAGEAPEEAEFEGMEEIHDTGARKVLKNLGYWQ